MNHLYEQAQQGKKDRDTYFTACDNDIAASNLRTLRRWCRWVLVLLLILIALANWIFANFRLRWPYLGFWGLDFLYLLLVELCVRRGVPLRMRQVETLCAGFCVMTMACCMMLDIYANLRNTASFMPVLYVLLTVVFIFPYRVQAPLVAAGLAADIGLTVLCKAPELAAMDCFNNLFGALAAFVTARIVMDLRVRDGLARARYKQIGMMDALTGVNNRAACEAQIRRALARPDGTRGLLMLDVDNFKKINDKLGHQAGDQVLQMLGRLLRQETRAGDVVGRLGGDEFMICLNDVQGVQGLKTACTRILKDAAALAEDMSAPASRDITLSIGAVLVEGTADFEVLYRMADDALYAAKNAGRNSFVVVDCNAAVKN